MMKDYWIRCTVRAIMSIAVLFWISVGGQILLGCGAADVNDLEYELVGQGVLCSGTCTYDQYSVPMHLSSAPWIESGTLDPFESSPGVRLLVDPAYSSEGIEHEAVCVDGHTYYDRTIEFIPEGDTWTFYEGTCDGETTEGALIIWTLYKGF